MLNIDFGSHILLCILLSILGSLAGLSIGLLVSVLFKTNENTKVGIIIAISMVCSFLSGMMGITMKYIVDNFHRHIHFATRIESFYIEPLLSHTMHHPCLMDDKLYISP